MKTLLEKAVVLLGRVYVVLARRVFPQAKIEHEQEHEHDAALQPQWTIQVVRDAERNEYRALVLCRLDGKEFGLKKTTLEWVLMDVKTAILAKARLMERAQSNEEPRIIVPGRFAANGSR